MARTGELYDQDFVLWTEEQAAALRRAKDFNLPLDPGRGDRELGKIGPP